MTSPVRHAAGRAATAALGVASLAVDGVRVAAGLAARATSGTLRLAGVATDDEADALIRRVEALSRAVRRHEERSQHDRAE